MKMHGGWAEAAKRTYLGFLCLTAVAALHAADVDGDACEEDVASALSLLQTQSTAIIVAEDGTDDFYSAGKHDSPLPKPSFVEADHHRHLYPGIVPPAELHLPLAGVSRSFTQDIQDYALISDGTMDRLPRQTPSVSLIEKEATSEVDLVNSFKLICIALAFCCCISYFWNVSDYIDANRTKNAAAKDLRKMFDKECKEEDKENYCSEEFKKKCEQIFKQADTKQTGHLTLKELRGPLQEYYGKHERRAANLEVVIQAFDDNNNQSIESDEFFEMMKYFEWQKDEKTREESASRALAEAANAG